MGTINETFILKDGVCGTLDRIIGKMTSAYQAVEKMNSILSGAGRQLITLNAQFAASIQEQNAMATASQQNSAGFAALDARAEQLGGAIQDVASQYNAAEKEAEEAAAATKQFDSSAKSANTSSDKLTSTLKRLASAYLGVQTLKQLVSLSDEMTSINARLELMTGSAEAAAEAQDQIYAAAIRSRGAYTDMADTVAKLGTLAPDAFSGTDEIVAFAEQLQKQMVLSGTSTQSAQAAMVQLTQGLSSGALRGEELNSILEQTPMIAQTIANYMGVTTGEMRELASEGKVTADVVKNAMFAAAEETDAKFAEMPMTWGQVWTQVQNIAIQALQPLLDVIGQFAQFVSDNIDTIIPILYGVATAVGILAAAYAVWKIVTTAQSIAQGSLNKSLLGSPITWIIVAIAAIIGAIVAWIQSVGGLQIAWLIVVDALLYAWDTVKTGFMTGVYFVMDLWDKLGLALQTAGTNIANFMGDMKVNVLTILQNMVNGAIDIINWFIEKLNILPGVSIDTIDHVTFATTASLENEAAKAARNADLTAAQEQVAQDIANRQQALDDMWAERDANHAARQQEIADKQAASASGEISTSATSVGYTPYDELAGDVSSIAKSASSIEKSVNMADEDLQNLVDMAERQYVNKINLTAQTPVITINGANTGNTEADRKALADTIRDIILEQAASASLRSTARVYSGG